MKNYCQVCGKPCGEYVLCQECFEEMQRGNLDKCKNCGNWYRIGEVCQCFKVHENERTNVNEVDYEDCEPALNDEEEPVEERRGCAGPIILFFVLAMICIIPILLATKPWKDDEKTSSPHSDSNTGVITQMTKNPPDVSFKDSQSFTDLKNVCILVEANDDYKEVQVELCLYDKNGTVIVKKTLTETNLKKGNTYELTYNMSWSEALKCERGSCKLISYK